MTTTPRELLPEDVTLTIDTSEFDFTSTDELDPLDGIVGQPRAMRALDVGLGVKHRNYHIYVSGLTGTSRLELIRDAIRERTSDSKPPADWIYVNNFDQPDCPTAISLPPGDGVQLKHEMSELVEHLREALPRAFRQEDFGNEREKLRQHYHDKRQELLHELEQLAEKDEMGVQQLPDGEILFIPLKDGRPMTPEEVNKLTQAEIKGLEKHQDKLVHSAEKVIEKQLELQKQLTSDVRNVARKFAEKLIDPLVNQIRQRFVPEDCHAESAEAENAADCDDDDESSYGPQQLDRWLEKLNSHLLEHLERFRDLSDVPPAMRAMIAGDDADSNQAFLEYQVNVLVDNSDRTRAPVVIEQAPGYRNLFGTIERIVDRSGRVITNFTRIKSGSLMRANGGYLVLDLMDALMEPLVWKQLKRALKSGLIEIEAYDPFAMFTVSGLKPQSIPINVRLIVAGEPLIYHMLFLHDEDFREIFRVKADFDDEVTRDEHAGRLYGGLAKKLSTDEGLRPVNADGVAVLIREGARQASSKQKLTTVFSHIADIVREADYWARQANQEVITEQHIEMAVRERIGRSDLIAERIREMINNGSLLINVEGAVVGQINGLSVIDLGDYAFGRPSRITASVGVGAMGIVNIERESRLSGRTYDKGLLILGGYFRAKYATDMPVALSASLAMEQNYGGVDGDSATAAELICLLSAVADVPIRQDIAITGSINQNGEIQTIGGVNEKIEGFFDVCKMNGLTGTQGVCIPAANTQHVILRLDVVEAIADGRFHVWPVSNIDEVIELMTGTAAGSPDIKGSVHGKVCTRLEDMAAILDTRHFGSDRLIWTPGSGDEPMTDPRPPLPGREAADSSDET